jgi:hypothetical protein
MNENLGENKALVRILTPRGRFPVMAEVHGALALHETYDKPREGEHWSITHVPSGRLVAELNYAPADLARALLLEILSMAPWDRLTTDAPDHKHADGPPQGMSRKQLKSVRNAITRARISAATPAS